MTIHTPDGRLRCPRCEATAEFAEDFAKLCHQPLNACPYKQWVERDKDLFGDD